MRFFLPFFFVFSLFSFFSLASTALHEAAFSLDSVEFKKTLKTWERNVNTQDENGYTPLHIACFFGIKEIIEALILAGSSNYIKDNKGDFPSDIAKRWGHTKVYLFLNFHRYLRKENQQAQVDLTQVLFQNRVFEIGIRKTLIRMIGREHCP